MATRMHFHSVDESVPPGNQLLLGWRGEAKRQAFGFADEPSLGARIVEQMIAVETDIHAMTIAPTGAGKGRGVVIPNLLHFDGSVVAIDVKGELFDVTAEHRAKFGRVHLLDPFRLRPNAAAARLNPFDLLMLPGASLETDAVMMASHLAAGHDFSTDAYWNDAANSLVGSMIAHLATGEPAESRTIRELRDRMLSGMLEQQIAHWLDAEKVVNPMARRGFESYLEIPSDKTRPSVLSTARSYFQNLDGRGLEETFSHSTIDLTDVICGEPMTIYIVVPATKLHSHRLVLRLILATLMTAIMSRTSLPERRTLFMLDEAAQLGHMPTLVQAQTLLRSYGLQVWSFWQNVSQMKKLYPEWETLVDNCAFLQVFGSGHHTSVQQAAELIGVGASDIRSLGRNEQFLSFTGEKPLRCRRLDYLRDPFFRGKFRENTWFKKLTTEETTDSPTDDPKPQPKAAEPSDPSEQEEEKTKRVKKPAKLGRGPDDDGEGRVSPAPKRPK